MLEVKGQEKPRPKAEEESHEHGQDGSGDFGSAPGMADPLDGGAAGRVNREPAERSSARARSAVLTQRELQGLPLSSRDWHWRTSAPPSPDFKW